MTDRKPPLRHATIRPAARLAALLLAAVLPLALALTLAGCGEEQPRQGENATDRPSLQADATSAAPQAAGPKPAARTPVAAPTNAPSQASVPIGKGFDFYVLSLSWSPTWCMDNDEGGQSEQCRTGRNAGFIVHGLWPQNDRGYPEFCRTREPDRVPSSLGRSYLDIIPSMGLIGHQWRKHGSCSGLTQRDYLAVTRAAFERIALPASLEEATGKRRGAAEIEAALVEANPGLTGRGIAVTCDDGRLDEIRICLTPGLAFRDCGDVDRTGCRARIITQPPIR